MEARQTDLIAVRPVGPADRSEWGRLYAEYLAFYETRLEDEQVERVWDWLMLGDHALRGLVAVGTTGQLIGLAHYREFVRPSAASLGGYLDDLFVDPAERASGVADALLAALRDIAMDSGWSVVRWITADNNYRARSKYDGYALRTSWVTYDMPT